MDDDDDFIDDGYSKPGPSHKRASADEGYPVEKSADRGYPMEGASAQDDDRYAPSVATSQGDIEPLDEGEDFTIDELKSLLQNFDYLSGTEQVRLALYKSFSSFWKSLKFIFIYFYLFIRIKINYNLNKILILINITLLLTFVSLK